MLNQIVMVGRIKEIQEIQRDETSRRYTIISIVVPRNFKNEEGEYEDDTFRVKVIGVVAESTTEYCKQGDLIGVKGRLQSNGVNNVPEIIGEKVTFLSSKRSE